MKFLVKEIKCTDAKDLSVQMEFAVACSKVNGEELVALRFFDFGNKSRNSIIKILRGMKRDNVIRLFVFDDDLYEKESTESVFMLNKFPALADFSNGDKTLVYIKI